MRTQRPIPDISNHQHSPLIITVIPSNDKLFSMEIANQPPESFAPWMPAITSLTVPADRLRAWWERARRVYPETTKKAWRCDWVIWLAFCEPKMASPPPATPETVASFVDACRLDGKKPATIRRYLSTIGLAHRLK